MARKSRLSPAEREVQDYLAQVSAGQAGTNPAAQTLARSNSNPRAQAFGQRMVDRQQAQNAANRDDAASEAERQAKAAARVQEATQREQAAAQRAEQARNVRAAAAQGVATETDIETGRRTIATHDDGTPKFKVGPTGPVAPTTTTTTVDVAGQKAALPGASIMLGGDGAAGTAGTVETKTEFRQPIRDDRGNTRLVEPETKVDKETGFQYASGTDKSTGLPTKTVVGVDTDQRRANALGQQMQALDLRDNAVKQTQAQFLPKWKPIEDEYSRAKSEREKIAKTAFEKRNNSWVKVNREDGTEAIASVEEADAWRKRKEQTEGDFKRAETAYMKDVETAGNLERNVKDIADQKLKLAEEKIRLDSGLPANDGGVAFTMAEAEFGPSPATQAAAAVADEAIPPEAPKPVAADEALAKAFEGVAGIEGVTLEGTDVGYSWMMQDGLSIGRVDNRGKDTVIVLKPEATDLQAHVAKAGSGTVPIYLADNPDRPSEQENAQWAASVMQVVTNVAANPMQGADGGAAGIPAMSNNEFGSPAYDRVRAIEDMGADQDGIIRRVKDGTLSAKLGEALMQEVWGDTLKAPDPQAPETFQKFLSTQSPAFQREWQEANKDRDPAKLDELRGEFVSDWYARNQHKPGVTWEQQQKLRGNREARSIGDTAEIMAKGVGGIVVDAAGSMGGMIGGTAALVGLAIASPFSDTANDLRKAQADVLGRGFVNFNRGIAGNFKKYTTAEGKARLKPLADSSFELRYLIENRHGMDTEEFRQKLLSAAAQVGKDALAVHELNQEEGWAVEASDFDVMQDRALGTALLTYAETGDPAEWEKFQSRLLMDKGSRQAEELSQEVTAGKGRLAAAFASGVNAPPQEMLIELLSTTLTFGAGKALGTGTKAALKGSTAAGSRLARLRRAVAGVSDDFAKFGRFTDTLANPASKGKRLANKGIDLAKANTVEASGEAVEEGVAALADPNVTAESFFEQMGAGFLGGFILGPLIAAPGTISGIRQERGRKQAEIKSFADWYNRTNADTEGFTPLAPAEAEAALAMLDPEQHATLKGEHEAAVEEFRAATEELANSQAPGEVGVAGDVQNAFRESAASRVSRAMARAIETKAAVSNYVGGVIEASQSTKAMEAPERARILGLTKAATGRTDLLTGTERQAVAGMKTREGAPYFADVAGRTVFTAEGRAEVQTDNPLVGALIATDESKALVEQASRQFPAPQETANAANPPQPTPTNEQNQEGAPGPQAAQENAPPAGAAGQATGGSQAVGGGAGTQGAAPQGQAGNVAEAAPVAPNPAALDAAEYEALRQADPSLPDIATAVAQARAAGQPVSKSMARAAGVDPVANEANVAKAAEAGQSTPVPPPLARSEAEVRADIARGKPVKKTDMDAAGIPIPAGFHQVGDLVMPKNELPVRGPVSAANFKEATSIAEDLKAEMEAAFPKMKGKITISTNPANAVTGGVQVQLDGKIELMPLDIAVTLRGSNPDAVKAELYMLAVKHEMWHIAQTQVVRSAWERAGRPGSFGQFWKGFYGEGGLFDELMQTPGIFAIFKQIYDGKPLEEKGYGYWEQIPDKANQAAEGVRMLLEIYSDPKHKQHAAEISELLRAKGTSTPKIIQFLKDMVAALTEMLNSITDPGSSLGKAVKTHLDDVISAYRALMEAETTPESATTETPILRVIGDAIEAAKARDPRLNRERAREMEFAVEDLDAVMETMPADERRAFIDQAINEWLDSLVIEEEAATPEAKEKKQRSVLDNPARKKAFEILRGGNFETLSAVMENGKITPKPSAIGLILARQKTGKKLTEREMAVIRNKSEWDGAAFQNQYAGGGDAKVAREIIAIITAKQGEGRFPNKIAGDIQRGWTADDMWQAIGEELNSVARGKLDMETDANPNREWTDAEIEADMLRQAEEIDPEREAMDAEGDLAYVGPEVDEDGEILLSSPTPTPRFYSRLQTAVESADFGTSKAKPPMQWAGVILKWAESRSSAGGALWNKGISRDELKWSGIMTWLESQKRDLTKAEVLEHLRNEGAVRLQQVDLGKSEPVLYPGVRVDQVDGEWYIVTGVDDEGPFDSREEAQAALDDPNSGYWSTDPDIVQTTGARFSQYVLPGGENYREVVLAMPSAYRELGSEGKFIMSRFTEEQWNALTPREKEAVRDEYADLQRNASRSDYTSSHFPDVPNYVAHMRVNERQDAEGKPGLFIEEIQSDRGQAIRKEVATARDALDERWVEVVTRMKKDGILKVVCP